MAYTGVATDTPVLQSLQVGSGTTSTTLTAIGRISQSLTPVSVAATTCALVPAAGVYQIQLNR